jgi:hypothetical protein
MVARRVREDRGDAGSVEALAVCPQDYWLGIERRPNRKIKIGHFVVQRAVEQRALPGCGHERLPLRYHLTILSAVREQRPSEPAASGGWASRHGA